VVSQRKQNKLGDTKVLDLAWITTDNTDNSWKTNSSFFHSTALKTELLRFQDEYCLWAYADANNGQYHSNNVQGGSDMTGTNCDLFTHNQSRSYLNHLVILYILSLWVICIYNGKNYTYPDIIKCDWGTYFPWHGYRISGCLEHCKNTGYFAYNLMPVAFWTTDLWNEIFIRISVKWDYKW
jgi:hypothetical protein